jgi:hypothetical protein
MDHEIDKQKPSSKEGEQVNYKRGDKVWLLCEVAIAHNDESLYIDIRHDGAVFEAKRSDCRPVEPDHDDHPVEFKVGDRVVSWSGRQGVVESINEIEGFPITVRHSMREQVSYKLGDVKHDDRPVEPASPSEIPNSSSEPMAVGDAVRFIWPGHKWHRTEGTIVSTMGDPSIFVDIKEYPYRFKSDCGAFERWCSVDQLERLDKADPVNPLHYKQGGIECIEAIKAATGDGFIGYVWGNVLKYLWRWPKKGGVDDLKKARWYLDRLISEAGE